MPGDFAVLRAYIYAHAVYSSVMSPGGSIVNSLDEAVAAIAEIFKSTKHEIVFIVPPSVFSIFGTSFNTVQNAKRFVQTGGVMRGVTTISRANA